MIGNYIIVIPRHCIERSLGLSRTSLQKILDKLLELLPSPDFSDSKLGGQGKIIQIDEIMLNYKCKSHRGRSPTNRTDVLCIKEFGYKIDCVFAACIENKTHELVLIIICDQVLQGSIIHTDDAINNKKLSGKGYIHQFVIHKVILLIFYWCS